jgi:uncharacterized membrane protein YfcA
VLRRDDGRRPFLVTRPARVATQVRPAGLALGREPVQCVGHDDTLRPMMSTAALAILGLSILATSFLSGIFGMAGGLILLGICLALLDVAPAMVLHASTQFAANAWRATLWRGQIVWPILLRYAAATVCVYLLMRYFAVLPNKAVVYLLLGLMPFATELLPARLTPDIQRPGAPYLCGGVMALLQVLAGVGGNIVDVFFQNSKLDRRQIVATKSATQAVGHAMRFVYFGTFAEAIAAEIPVWVFLGAIVIAMTGTTLAGSALSRMSEGDFRRYSRWLIQTVALVFIARGCWLLASG